MIEGLTTDFGFGGWCNETDGGGDGGGCLAFIADGGAGIFGVRWLLKAPEPELFAEWHGDALQVLGRDGRWMITHLENVSDGTIARLPEPVWVVESGGVRFTAANLAQLKWVHPARGYDEVFSLTSGAAPKTGGQMQVLYFKAEGARTKAR